METYQEYIGRYRVCRRDEPASEAHRQAAIEAGVDPDSYNLIWSFDDLEAALECFKTEVGRQQEWEHWKLVDNKESSVIERAAII